MNEILAIAGSFILSPLQKMHYPRAAQNHNIIRCELNQNLEQQALTQ